METDGTEFLLLDSLPAERCSAACSLLRSIRKRFKREGAGWTCVEIDSPAGIAAMDLTHAGFTCLEEITLAGSNMPGFVVKLLKWRQSND